MNSIISKIKSKQLIKNKKEENKRDFMTENKVKRMREKKFF